MFVEDIKKNVDSFLIKRKYISYLIEWLHSSIFGGGSREHFGLQGTTFSVLGISTSATEKGGLSIDNDMMHVFAVKFSDKYFVLHYLWDIPLHSRGSKLEMILRPNTVDQVQRSLNR